MAVSLTTTTLLFRKKPVEVHSKKLTKSNKKGLAELVGGRVGHIGDRPTITIDQGPGGKILVAQTNDIIYRVGKSKKWQVATTAEFNRKFKVV